MANYNHVKVLKQGVTVWNKWRQNHPEVKPDLSRTNLRSAGCLDMSDLSSANLREVDLCGTYLFGIILTGADLTGANLREADLSRVNLEGANLTGADLRSADLEGANLKHVQLAGANLEKANLACAQVTTELRNARSIEGTILPDRLFYPESCYSSYWQRDRRVVEENWEGLVPCPVSLSVCSQGKDKPLPLRGKIALLNARWYNQATGEGSCSAALTVAPYPKVLILAVIGRLSSNAPSMQDHFNGCDHHHHQEDRAQELVAQMRQETGTDQCSDENTQGNGSSKQWENIAT